MKNLIYVGTALHMLFLANLSPCQAMDVNAEDSEGKKTTIKFDLNAEMIQSLLENIKNQAVHQMDATPEDITVSFSLKVNKPFALSTAQVATYRTSFMNSIAESNYEQANVAVTSVLNSPIASGTQREEASQWNNVLTTTQNLSTQNQTLTAQLQTAQQATSALDEHIVTLVSTFARGNKEEIMRGLYNLSDTPSPYKSQAGAWIESMNAQAT